MAMTKQSPQEKLIIKTDKENKKSFGFVNNTFINIYSEENPILNIGDECYFLFFHPINFHRTLIGKGTVTQQIYSDGLNVMYYVALEEILENKEIINKFVYGQKFPLWKFEEGKLHTERFFLISEKTTVEFLKTYLFKAESFFVRNSLKTIKILQKEYTEIIKKDIVAQLNDVNEILDITD